MTEPEYQPSWRKPFGMALILAIIGLWAFVIASLNGQIGLLPVWAQIIVYAIAGIVWILPLKPLLRWMETGQWR